MILYEYVSFLVYLTSLSLGQAMPTASKVTCNEWKRMRTEAVMAHSGVLSRHLSVETKQNYECHRSGHSIHHLRFEPGTFQIRVTNVPV
jgi:hypothetical protein